MILRLLFAAILLFSAFPVLCQEANTVKEDAITSQWHFVCENYIYSPGLDVRIARTEKGGVLELTEIISNDSFYIGGTVYIYLGDNTFIVCTDKGMHQNIDGKAVSYYNLTATEMKRLKTVPITSIRFTIKGIRGPFDSQTGNFTAVNRSGFFKPYKDYQTRFETETDINLLYPN